MTNSIIAKQPMINDTGATEDSETDSDNNN